MGPDFKAFEKYLALGFDTDTVALAIKRNVPITHPSLGNVPREYQNSPYLLLNIAAAAQGPEAREQMVQGLSRQMRVIPLHINGAPFNSGMPTDNSELREIVNKAVSTPALGGVGGGISMSLASTVLMDPRSIRKTGKAYMPDATEQDLTFYQNIVEHHEASHLILGLGEAGGDFVAAALSLRENPESRDILRQWADARLITGMNKGGDVADTYGSECHDAIERAMSMPPEQLKAMSVEELYEIGLSYDTLNQNNVKLEQSPENTVRDSMAEWDIGRGLKFLWNKVSNFDLPDGSEIAAHFQTEAVSIQDMRNNLSQEDFAIGSKERRMADNLAEALSRSRLREMPRPSL